MRLLHHRLSISFVWHGTLVECFAFICTAAVLALTDADIMVLQILVLVADAAQQAADQTQLQPCFVFI